MRVWMMTIAFLTFVGGPVFGETVRVIDPDKEPTADSEAADELPEDEYPKLQAGQYVVVDKSVDDREAAAKLEECVRTFDSRAYADYFAFVHSNKELYVYSENAQDVRAETDMLFERWSTRAVDPRRAVLVVYNVAHDMFAVQVGERWREAGFFEGPNRFRRTVKIGGRSFDTKVCRYMKMVEDTLTRMVEETPITSQRDVDARAMLVEERFRSAWDHSLSLRKQAEEELGPDSPLRTEIIGMLESEDAHAVIGELADGALSVERLQDAVARLRTARAMVERVRDANVRASDRLNEFRLAKQTAATNRRKVEELREQIDQRSAEQFIWVDEGELRRRLLWCEEDIDVLERDIAQGKFGIVIPEGIESCLDEIEGRVDDADLANMVVTRIGPAAVAVVGVGFFGLVTFRRRRRKRHARMELELEVGTWQDSLELLEGRLDEIFNEYEQFVRRDAVGLSVIDTRVDAETRQALERAARLCEVLGERFERAKAVSDEGASADKLEEALEWLTEEVVLELPGEPYEGPADRAHAELAEAIDDARAGLSEVA